MGGSGKNDTSGGKGGKPQETFEQKKERILDELQVAYIERNYKLAEYLDKVLDGHLNSTWRPPSGKGKGKASWNSSASGKGTSEAAGLW